MDENKKQQYNTEVYGDVFVTDGILTDAVSTNVKIKLEANENDSHTGKRIC